MKPIIRLIALMSLALPAAAMTTVTVTAGQSIATVVNGASVGTPGLCTPTSGWRVDGGITAGMCVHVASASVSGGSITNTGTASAPIVIIADNFHAPLVTSSLVVQNSSGANRAYIYIEGLHWNNPSQANAITLGPGHHRWVEFNLIENMDTTNGCDNPRGGVIQETFAPMDHDTINGNIVIHFGSTCADNGYHGIYADGAALTVTNNFIAGGGSGWGIQKQYASNTDCTPGVIANNTLINNAGGMVLNDEGSACKINNWTIKDNVIINSHCAGCGTGGLGGIDMYHMNGAPQALMTNNMVYGTLPAGADFICVASPCPTQQNTKTDAAPTSTFVNWVPLSNASFPVAFNIDNYQIKAGSNALANSTTACATGGFTPCNPVQDLKQVTRNSPATIGALEAGGGGGGGTPTIQVSPTTLPFGSITVGQSSAISLTTFTNIGTANLTLGVPAMGGTNVADFPFGGTGTCFGGIVIAPNANCTISNVFQPQATGARSATLSVPSNASNGTVVVTMTGTGTAPPVPHFIPPAPPISFGSVNVGVTSAPQNYRVDNTTGTAALTVNTRTINGQFAVSSNGTCGAVPFNVPAGSFCNFALTMTPTTTGAIAGTAVLTTNDASNPSVTTNLSGTGTLPGGIFAPTSLTFSVQTINTTSATQPIVWTNNGTGTATVSAVSISPNFTQSSTIGSLPAVILPGNSVTFNVACAPTVTGAISGQLSVTDDAPTPTQIAALSCTGQAAASNGVLIQGGVKFSGGVRILK